ncbi:hypothetical protein Sru01_08910 [Sphaerisporangium rufum]|uniref:Uncharacterized protein n=1 Tax=Sphaerisporangium rufum TaxID=1381558 RepID=A0A919QXF4_9ACTN|nr:hypothetical protein [Sphaerisporangium rufum]GII75909.1 hypothetical protein Sru01_08910 [Sphaerisporangium rufum]
MHRLYHLVAALSVLGPLALPSHPHPSGSTDRVTPGTVRIEARAHVSITLLDDRATIRQIVREYETPIGEGSGFTVTPEGVVVTATGVVRGRSDPAVHAANRVFAEHFKVKIPADFARHRLKDPDLNARLRACYPPQRSDSTCIATTTTKITVFPYADPPAPGGHPAEVLRLGAAPDSPAVLRLTSGGEEATLPTVPLGTALPGGLESVDVVGTPARPSAAAPPKVVTAHLDPPGGRTFKSAERAKLAAFVTADGAGAAVIDDARSEVIGLMAGGASRTVTPVDDVRAALVAAGVTPRRGPVDVVYEQALAPFHNRSFAAAVPVLEQVLRLRPDHAVAQDHLRLARKQAASARPRSPAPAPSTAGASAGGRSPLPVALVAAAAVLAAAVAGVLLLRRRTAAPGTGPPEAVAGAATWPPPGTQVMTAPGADVQQARSVPPDPPGAEPPAGPGGQVLFCTQCGMRLGRAHRFCGFCGHPAAP